jgi:hypothetical protein
MARGQRRSSLRNERAPQPADRKRSHSLAEAVAQPADATRVDIVHKASPRTRRPISGVPPGHYSSGTVAFQRPMTGVDNATRGNQLQVRLPDARRRSGGPLERAPGRFALGYAFWSAGQGASLSRLCRDVLSERVPSGSEPERRVRSGSVAGRAGSLRAEGPQGRGNHPADLRPGVRWRNAHRPAGTASQLSTRLGCGPMSTIILCALKRAKRALAVYRVSARGGSA